MKVIKGNIWDYWNKGYWIVIPTNGTIKKDGSCVMGRGLALQAKKRFPELPKKLGSIITNFSNQTFLFTDYNIFTFPVKNNWWEQGDLKLIEQSTKQLKFMIDEYNIKLASITSTIIPVLSKVGCGNGRLNWKDVEPILDKYLDNRFIIVDLK